jgi:hypothetical protein
MSTKKAFLMGINYRGTDSELNGCINDVYNIKDLLLKHLNYKEEEVLVMTDDTELKPTYNNITGQLLELAKKSYNENLEELVISYSGHGSNISDKNGDEDDKRDECLVPLDYDKKGLITDDLLNNIFGSFNPKTNVFFILDACHSETMLDTKYRYVSGNKSVIENPKCRISCDLLMLSGCQDHDYSSDAYDINDSNAYSGALTSAFLYVLKENNYNITCWKMLKDIRTFLRQRKFSQKPQICCTKQLNKNTILFNNSDITDF